ncbi:Alpha/Beta hydrolase protein [Cladorrhinum samala]|uniref:Alpha/Beta hydrolase protein n=1 Tax=Cladorrhinum samala TaxID=585594 RepID=A0AAV9HNM2_9PEZI|nr:Alpha/Beta hydrolase protein [Cladorrhinum samala]
MGFATTDDGEEIYFQAHGTSGPILVFVSGYFGVDNIWQPLITKLRSQYRCIAYDSRGYGRSSKPTSPDNYSIPRHAADLRAVLQACNITDRVVLVTHSMGCNIATAYYLAHPDHVAGIIYSAAYFDGEHIKKFFPMEVLTSGVDSPSQCVAFYANMGLDESTAIEAAKWPAYIRRNNAKALLGFKLGDQYSGIKVPGLVIHGEADSAAPEELVTPIVQAMPSCKLEILKGVRHFPPTEAPEEMERLIREFVSNLS